jgi:hypothetical protein
MMAIGLCQPFFSAFWVGNGKGGGRRIILNISQELKVAGDKPNRP